MKTFIDAYGILFCLFVGSTALSFVWLVVFNREKLQAKWWELLIAAFAATITGFLGSLIFGYIESGLKGFGPISLFGGVFVVPLFCLVFGKIKKIPFGTALDVFTIVLVVSAMFARINCFIHGCCYGKEIGYTEFRYPTRELEIGFDVIFIGISIFLILKNKTPNKVYFIYLISYGTFRFVIEFFRHSDNQSVFHNGHIWSFLSLLIGISVLIIQHYLNKQKEINESKNKRK